MNKNTDSQYVVDELIQADKESRLTRVTVFTDQAWSNRRARTKALKGLNRYHIELQAFFVDADSAQARVFGDGDILSVQYKTLPVKAHPHEKIQVLEKEKEKLASDIKALKSMQKIKEKQSAFLDGMVDFSQVEIPKKMKTSFPSTQDLNTMLDFLGSQYQGLSEAALELELNIKELNKDLSVIEQKLKALRHPEKKQQHVIEVLFDGKKDQEISIEVSYAALNASWEPVYKVEALEDLGHVNLTMFAKIQQQTGENWSEVQLAVSNAVPMKGTALPDIESWHLYFPAPQPPMGAVAMAGAPPMRARKVERDAEEMLMDDLAEPVSVEAAPEAGFFQAKQKELPLAFEYHLPQPVTHSSGSGDTLLPLFTKKLDGDFFLYTVPKTDPLGYLVSRATSDQALLSGRLNVHFGGRYVGGSWLSEKKAGEDLLINLGVDTGLKVRREKTTDKVAETFFGKVERSTKAREMVFVTTLENLKETRVRVQVQDALPVSDTDRIQVKGIELDPEPAERDFKEKEGVCKWLLDIEPGAIQKITTRFFIKHPKDQTPEGL